MASEYKQLAVKMEPEKRRCLSGDDKNLEYRVNVRSKEEVTEQINKYKTILETALDGQPDMKQETKRVLLQELMAVGHSS